MGKQTAKSNRNVESTLIIVLSVRQKTTIKTKVKIKKHLLLDRGELGESTLYQSLRLTV